MAYAGIDYELWIPIASAQTAMDLGSLIVASLFSDARAHEDDSLPTISDPPDLGGWWADAFATNDTFGSRLWLLRRSTLTDKIAQQAEEYAREALQWMIDDKICSRIDVTVIRNGQERGDMLVTPYKQDGAKDIEKRFESLWSNLT